MYIPRRFPEIANRRLFLAITLVVLAGFCSAVTAQTAPQLLPYTVKLIAGGGTVAIATGGTCPVSGKISTDAYGDGCLATEIQLASPRYAAADQNGNVFFSDYTSGLVRRVDSITGVVTAVAGGATASPASGTACGAYTSSDAKGDGCLGTAVKLSHPTGLVFSPAGDLYFGDSGYGNVRKIAATNGVIATSGIISLVDGNAAGTYGYAANNSSGNIVAATAGYLDAPFGLAFDANGDLYIDDEFKEAIVVVNTNATGSTTVAGVSIPAGTVAKIVGTPSSGGPNCPNSPASTSGCNYGLFTSGAVANASEIDAPYGVAVDSVGNVYFANEYENNVGLVSPAGILTNYGGIQGTAGKVLTRAAGGSFGIGSDFGIAADANSNVYVTDASSGVIWRIDGAGQSMYVVAGGGSPAAGSPCSAGSSSIAKDAYGDGCPATQAQLGSSQYAAGSPYASTTAPGPGVFGVSVDAYSDLFFGDTETSLIREVSSGTQFGYVGAIAPTQIADIHFAAGDTPAASAPYALTAGAANFVLGTAHCTVNSDTTDDCTLPITATPTGVSTGSAFTGTLQVTSAKGATGTFLLSGTYFGTPATTTSVAIAASCAGNTVFLPATAVTFKATVASSGSPTGTVTFAANGVQIGTPQPVTNGIATLSYTFAAPGTYAITGTYSGDGYFAGSTGQSPSPVYSQNPSFNMATISAPLGPVFPGGAALYSFLVVPNVYTGTIAFSVSGLPPNSTYTMTPTTVTTSSCSTGSTVSLSIITSQGSAVLPASIGLSGGGWRSTLSLFAAVGLALLIGIRRRRSGLRYGGIWIALALFVAASSLVACNNVQTPAGTPAGPYTVMVTATGSAGATSALTLPTFTVN